MSKRIPIGFLIVIVPLLATLSQPGGALAQAKASTTMTKVTGPYKLKLIIGSAETMSMSMHGKASERMIGGKNATCDMSMHMAMLAEIDKSKMQTCNHHVEVHVYVKKTNKVVTNAKVAISLQGQGMHGGTMMITVPIMTMEGMKAGPSDFHYGNNIYAAPGKYTVHVTVNGAKANFSVALVGAM